jgi:hypothetical protein
MSSQVQKLGEKCVALELKAVCSHRQGCCFCSVMDRISRACISYFSTPSRFDCVLRTDQNRVVTHISFSSAVQHAGVRYALFTAYYAHVLIDAVYQACSDIAIVILWWIPKAFKGKGQTLDQSCALSASLVVCAPRGGV